MLYNNNIGWVVGWRVGQKPKLRFISHKQLLGCGSVVKLKWPIREEVCWMMVVVYGGEESPLHISRAVSVSHSSDQFMNARMYICIRTEITREARFRVYITRPTQHNSTTSTQTALIRK